MIVYFAGGEDIDFAPAGGASPGFSGGAFDGAWSRGYVFVPSGITTWPLSTYIGNPVSLGSLSSFWMHHTFYINSNATTSGYIWIAFADSGGVGRILIRGTGTAGQAKISSRNAAGTIVDFAGAVSSSGLWPTNGLAKFDAFVNYSVSGRVQFYINGVLAADTGAGVNVTTDSATSLSYFYISAPGSAIGNNNVSQVFVADSDTRGASLWQMNSSTAGNAQTWTGTASNVNKSTISDTTFITAVSNGLINEYKTGGIALPAGVYTVGGVKMISRAQIGASGPQHVQYVSRVGSTDYMAGSWLPPVGSFGNDPNGGYYQMINPGTGLAWTTADLTAATFNYGVASAA